MSIGVRAHKFIRFDDTRNIKRETIEYFNGMAIHSFTMSTSHKKPMIRCNVLRSCREKKK